MPRLEMVNLVSSSNKSLVESIENCLLPRLSRTLEECDTPPEFNIRASRLDRNILDLQKNIEDLKSNNQDLTSSSLALLVILYYEIKSTASCQGNTEQVKLINSAQKLNSSFHQVFYVNIYDWMKPNFIVNRQELFQTILECLHSRVNTINWKNYPMLIEVYCSIILSIKECQVSVCPAKSFPLALILTDDYIKNNKVKGLTCCNCLLSSMNSKDFEEGNYYEVIFKTLMNVLNEKDLEVVKLVSDCFISLLPLLPQPIKILKTDETLSTVLDQISLEGNLNRKQACFVFVTKLIIFHGIHCSKRKKLMHSILYENIDLCCNDAIGEVLLHNVLDCLELWISHCWCAWQYTTDQKIISVMLKLLYVIRNEECTSTRVEKIIATLTKLCKSHEQEKIIGNLNSSNIKCITFERRIKTIKCKIKNV